MAKGRDSDMPALQQWESYFDAEAIMESFGCRDLTGDVVEFGCGYGTFTIHAGRKVQGKVYALDIDPFMVQITGKRIVEAGLTNVEVEERDFDANGSGRPSESVSLALQFNILHIENPVALLKEAHRILRPGGALAVIHWNHDAQTPRGPPLEIRPLPEQCRSWGERSGFRCSRNVALGSSPWHWGMLMMKV